MWLSIPVWHWTSVAMRMREFGANSFYVVPNFLILKPTNISQQHQITGILIDSCRISPLSPVLSMLPWFMPIMPFHHRSAVESLVSPLGGVQLSMLKLWLMASHAEHCISYTIYALILSPPVVDALFVHIYSGLKEDAWEEEGFLSNMRRRWGENLTIWLRDTASVGENYFEGRLVGHWHHECTNYEVQTHNLETCLFPCSEMWL